MNYLGSILLVGALLALPQLSYGQVEDTTVKVITREMISQMPMRDSIRLPQLASKHISPISVVAQAISIRIFRAVNPNLDRETIENLSPDDVGELMGKLTGTTVKSYGGLGGLKSISIRAMGSQHTAMVVDGFNISNSQSGQINLGQIQTDGLRNVQANSNGTSSIFIPVSARISSNSLVLTTFQNGYGRYDNQLRLNAKYGSFNRFDGYASGMYSKKKKLFISGYAKYRQSDGDYKYSFQNGLSEIDGERQNNDYQDAYLGAQLRYNGKNQVTYRIGCNASYIDQGLPGAVVLYNETADERLNTMDLSAYGDAYWHKDNWYFRGYGSVNRNNQIYDDPTYFNSQGFINTQYLNQNASAGFVFSKSDYQKINFQGGVEENISMLVSSDSSLLNPIRSHTSAFASAEKNFGFGPIKIQLSGQYINQSTRIDETSNELFKLNPSVHMALKERRKWGYTNVFWYKNTFRMPSFNELFYNYVGNSDLKPETAHQFNYGLNFIPKEGSFRDVYVKTNLYFNRVQNKIIAIPTKNLFVWSTQNVADVNVFGGEFSLDYKWRIGSWDFNGLLNYSYQKAIDVTDGSLNYGDQIAYVPEHMSNADIGVTKNNFSFRVSNNFVAGRYALNENIDQNLVKGYLITDFMVKYNFDLKKDRKIILQANLKNAFNQSYAYVRSFVMPGRNFLISVSYAIH